MKAVVHSIFYSIVILHVIPSLSAQCVGPQNGGAERVFLLNTGTDNFSFDVNGLTIDIAYDNVSNVTISGPGGISFLSNGAGFAENVSQNTDIAALSPYVPGPLKLYDTSIGANGSGTFGGGIGGFVAFQFNGNFGWIELDLCGRTACSDYRFTVKDGLFENQASANVPTGVCPAVQPENIPTLSQWGLIVLFLCMLIFGTVSILSERKKAFS